MKIGMGVSIRFQFKNSTSHKIINETVMGWVPEPQGDSRGVSGTRAQALPARTRYRSNGDLQAGGENQGRI